MMKTKNGSRDARRIPVPERSWWEGRSPFEFYLAAGARSMQMSASKFGHDYRPHTMETFSIMHPAVIRRRQEKYGATQVDVVSV